VEPVAAAALADEDSQGASVEGSEFILGRALDGATILRESQKENARRMARDLRCGRLAWESVPFRILFEPNRRCNVKCVHCDIDRRGTGELPVAVLERLLDEIGGGTMEVMPLLGGEPTLGPIGAIASIVRRHGNYLNFITNGIRFTRSLYDPIADVTARVQFSFPSHRREAFERIMPQADYDVVVRNIGDAVRIAERTGAHVLTCVVPMLDLLDDLDGYVRFVADLGVRRVIVQNLYPHTLALAALDPRGGRSPEAVASAYARVLDTAKRLGVFVETNVAELFGDPENVPRRASPFDILQDSAHIVALFRPGFCISTAIQMIVEWTGTVLPCIRDRIVLGNLRTQGFREIWNGEAMQRLRRSHFEQSLSPRCATCKRFYLGHP